MTNKPKRSGYAHIKIGANELYLSRKTVSRLVWLALLLLVGVRAAQVGQLLP